jgi:multisubunit Na+/H+ antiporter MnhB subunit
MKRFAPILLVIMAVQIAFGQEKATSKEERIAMIEAQIAQENKRAMSGLLYGGAGLGVTLLSLAFIPGTECDYSSWDYECKETGSSALFWTFLVGGTALATVGTFKMSIASSRAADLKRKWYDLKYSYHPLYLPEQGKALGLAVVGRF